jgi:hypothetical protein
MKHKVPREKMIELKKKYEECEKIRKNKWYVIQIK